MRMNWYPHRLLPAVALAATAWLAAGANAQAQVAPVQLNVPSVAPGGGQEPVARRETILVTGSSTVFPFTNAVAQRLVEARGRPKPFIDATGTVRGYNLFCQGAGLRYPDMANASRRMNITEFNLCGAKGVHEIIEIPIGYDGIVVATRKEAVELRITRAQLWMAVAREVPRGGQFVANPYTRWRQIDPALPDWPIELLGPPPTSGTRDSFVELAMLPGCNAVAEVRAIADAARRRTVCATVREDGRWIDAGEDDAQIVARITAAPPGAVQGIFGFSFLVANADRIEGATIDGVEDTADNIASGRYPLARPLFVYVKRPNLRTVPGLKDFIDDYLAAIAPGGYLAGMGLVPLTPGRLEQVRQSVRDQVVMTRRPQG
jgi:phosphate transport system substrate-binding protein